MIRIVTSFAVFTATLVLALPANAVGPLTRTFVSPIRAWTPILAPPFQTARDVRARLHRPDQCPAESYAALDPGKYGALTIGMLWITVNGNGW